MPLCRFTVTSSFFPVKIRFHKLSDPPPAKCSQPEVAVTVNEDPANPGTGVMADYVWLDPGWRYRVSFRKNNPPHPLPEQADWANPITIDVPPYGEPTDLSGNRITVLANNWAAPVTCSDEVSAKQKGKLKRAPTKKKAAPKKA